MWSTIVNIDNSLKRIDFKLLTNDRLFSSKQPSRTTIHSCAKSNEFLITKNQPEIIANWHWSITMILFFNISIHLTIRCALLAMPNLLALTCPHRQYLRSWITSWQRYKCLRHYWYSEPSFRDKCLCTGQQRWNTSISLRADRNF